jgi:hypothetical protein
MRRVPSIGHRYPAPCGARRRAHRGAASRSARPLESDSVAMHGASTVFREWFLTVRPPPGPRSEACLAGPMLSAVSLKRAPARGPAQTVWAARRLADRRRGRHGPPDQPASPPGPSLRARTEPARSEGGVTCPMMSQSCFRRRRRARWRAMRCMTARAAFVRPTSRSGGISPTKFDDYRHCAAPSNEEHRTRHQGRKLAQRRARSTQELDRRVGCARPDVRRGAPARR